MALPFQKWEYAALSEISYRRHQNDQRLIVDDLGEGWSIVSQEEYTTSILGSGLFVATDGFIVSTHGNGFTAFVAEKNGNYVIVFRGSDAAQDAGDEIRDALISSAEHDAGLDYNGTVADYGDWQSNGFLARGTYGSPDNPPNQWESARVLVEYVINTLAAGDSSKVSVTGQSLGGGLAGLAAISYDLEAALFGPASFAHQLDIEADVKALQFYASLVPGPTVVSQYHQMFSEDFRALSIDMQAYYLFSLAVVGVIPVPGERYSVLEALGFLEDAGLPDAEARTAFDDFISMVESRSADVRAELELRRNSSDKIYISSVQGEFTTNQSGYGSGLGFLLDAVSEDFRQDQNYDNNFDVGAPFITGTFYDAFQGEGGARHSPALHALLALTSTAESPSGGSSAFGDLLANNGQLRSVLFNDVGAAAPLVSQKLAVSGISVDPSATGNVGDISAEPLYRALWKSYQGDRVFFDYFVRLYGQDLKAGAAAEGFDVAPAEDASDILFTFSKGSKSEASLNHALTQLSLGVLRDALANTPDLEALDANLEAINVTNFQFAGDVEGNGYIQIDLTAITSADSKHIDAFDSIFGLRELNVHVAERSYEAIETEGGDVDWLNVSFEDRGLLYSGSATLQSWGLVIVQTGTDSLLVDATELRGSTQGALIIAEASSSSGNDYLKTGGGDDWIMSGDGNDIVDAGEGTNVIISGPGDDRIKTGNGQDIVFSGEGNDHISVGSGADRVDAGEGNDFIQSNGAASILKGGAGDDVIVSRGAFTTIEGGEGKDIIHASGFGSIISGGAGADIVVAGSKAALFIDASADDRIIYGTKFLTGALAPMPGSDKGSAINLAQSVRYSMNKAGELIIEGVGGQQLFVAGADVGPDAKSNTAGLFVAIAEWSAYRLMDPDFPGGGAYIDGFKDVMDAIWAVFYGVDVVGSDPLVLDLDGDGIELSARSSRSPVFDIDADGFGEKTGWVYGGDGFLAIDTNNDGIINDVTELFGDAVTSGFEELATYDLNEDGVIDGADPVFSVLRVWRDSDSDGITDAGELLSLSDLGIVSINLPAGSQTARVQAGNTITATSTFTLADGLVRTIADVSFNVDQVDTVFLGDNSVSVDAAALPDLKGSGELPSLRVAATLQPGLVAIAQQTAMDTGTPDLVSLASSMRPLLAAWAGGTYTGEPPTVPPPGQLPETIYYQYAVEENGTINVVRYIYAALYYDGGTDSYQTYYRTSTGAVPTDDGEPASFSEAFAWMQADAVSKGEFIGTFTSSEARVLERFTGQNVPFEDIFGDAAEGSLDIHGLYRSSADEREAFRSYLELYASLETRAAVAFAVQSGLSGYFPDVVYDGDEGVFTSTSPDDLKASYMAILGGAPATAPEAAAYLEDWAPFLKQFLGQFDRGEDFLVNSYSYQFANLVRGYEAQTSFPVSIAAAAASLGIPGVTLASGTSGADIIYVSNGDATVNGGKGLDSYVFGGHFGDVVIDDLEAVGESGAAPDNIRFAVHASTDVTARREGNDLILEFLATGQSVRVEDQFLRERFSSTGTRLDNDRGVVEIVFADGVVWDEMDIARAAANPEAGDQVIIGTRHFDWLDGGAGNDLLQGGNSTDVYIFGEGYGHDTIHEYGPGLGSDNAMFILLEGDDFVRFTDGITVDDLVFSRDGNSPDLVVTITATGETLTVRDQFLAHNTGPFGVRWYDRVEMFSFDEDGSLLTWEDVLRLVTTSTSGDDTIYGFYYRDELDGGAGNDFLSGGDESDTYYFGRGDGSDTIREGQTNVLTPSIDQLVFKRGVSVEDVVFTRDGGTDDLIVSIAGTNDRVRISGQYTVTETGPFGAQAFHQVERFVWADGTIMHWADMRQGLIDAARTDGDDAIYGTHFNDTLNGGPGNDTLRGGNGADTYVFSAGDGQNLVVDYGSNILAENGDRIVFTNLGPSDFVMERVGNGGRDLKLSHAASGLAVTVSNQFEYTTLENLRLYEVEEFSFAGGIVWTAQAMREEWIARNSTSGNDTITGFWTDDTITGGAGNDILRGGDGSDTYHFGIGDGIDTIEESIGNPAYDDYDVLQFGAGLNAADALFTRTGDTLIINFSGRSEEVRIVGQFTPNAYFGSWTDIESFRFGDGTVITPGAIRLSVLAAQSTAGNDTIDGFYTADVIEGGTGDDLLRGSSGGDTYLYNAGDGDDLIEESVDHHLFLDGPDRLVFGAGIARSDVTFSFDGDDLIATISGGGSIRIRDHLSNRFAVVETFEFSDGTILTASEAETNAVAGQSTPGNDTIIGSNGHDIIIGGTGNDLLKGGQGSDIYVFNLGDGQDTIDDDGGYDSTGNADTLAFGAGISSTGVSLTRTGNNLLISIDGTTDSVLILGHFEATGYNSYLHWQMIDRITFDDGVTWEFSDLRRMLLAQASTSGNDIIHGFWTADTITGGAGNDELRGSTGGDTYRYSKGDGNDVIIEQLGHHLFLDDPDRILFGADVSYSDVSFSLSGNDLIVTVAGSGTIRVRNHLSDQFAVVETFEFADGTVITASQAEASAVASQWTNGNDTITGTNSGDTIYGGPGNDLLIGKSGSDTYIFNLGDGQDIIDDDGGYDSSGTKDTLLFGQGIKSTDVTLQRNGNDLLVLVNGTEDSVLIRGHFEVTGFGSYLNWQMIERLAFDDGIVWEFSDVRRILLDQARTPGNDIVRGFWTADILDGGAGDDQLIGSTGGDTYVWGIGSGNDTIYDNPDGHPYLDGSDRIEFGAGLSAGSLRFSRAGNDLVFTIISTGETLTVQRHFDSSPLMPNRIEAYQFRSGGTISLAEIHAGVMVSQATAGNDTILGAETADILAGGQGNDRMEGGAGSDTYRYGVGDGHDIIDERAAGGSDRLVFGPGINRSDVSFARSGEDAVITISTHGGSVRLVSQFATSYQYQGEWIEAIEFGNGEVMSFRDMANAVLVSAATSGNDTLTGYVVDEVLDGLGGNDTLTGLGGADTYLIGADSGNDTVLDSGSSAGDRIEFGPGILPEETQFIRMGNSLIIMIGTGGQYISVPGQFDGAVNRIEQFAFESGVVLSDADVLALATAPAFPAATVVGNTAANTLNGTSGNDVFFGDLGNDRLVGGAGGDLYVWMPGHGNDTISDVVASTAGNEDTLLLYRVSSSDVELRRTGDHLRINHLPTGEYIVVENWYLQIDGRYKLDKLEFSNGETWDRSAIEARAWIWGTTEADTLNGFDNTNDTLFGRQGADTLNGRAGSDIYMWRPGDGNDVILDAGLSGNTDTDSLVLSGVASGDATLNRLGNDLYIVYGPTREVLKVQDHFRTDTTSSQRLWKLEAITLTDLTWDAAVLDAVTVTPTNAGTAGHDILSGTSSANTLQGNGGNDFLYGNDGSDTYIFNAGDGIDTIEDNGSADTDRIVIGGYLPSDTAVARFSSQSSTLVISFPGSDDRIIVRNTLNGDNADGIERIEFSDGTVWTMAGVRARLVQEAATSGDDTIYGFDFVDSLEGGAGDDFLSGGDGSDTYIFNVGDGADRIEDNGFGDTDRLVIHGYAPADAILTRASAQSATLILGFTGSTDKVTLYNTLNGDSYQQIEQIVFDDGTTWTMANIRSRLVDQQETSGDDTIYGFDFVDTLEGGAGDDFLSGGDGSDTYIFNVGDGADRIEDNGFGDTDRLVIHGYAPADAILTRASAQSATLILGFTGSTDKVTLYNTLNENSYYQIEQIVFDDSTTWTMANIRSRLMDQQETSGDDTIYGFDFVDTLEGGAGDDFLSGGDGSDTYIFNVGDGADTIDDNGYADTDRLLIHGYTPADVILSRAGSQSSTLVIGFAGSSDRITIIGTLNGSTSDQVEQIVFDDGTIWTMAQVNALLNAALAPVVLDLNRDGQYFSAGPVIFDYDGDGVPETGAWVGAGDGILVLDRNGDGLITDGTEMSFIQDLSGAGTDLQGLAAFDSNSDGLLSSADAAFTSFSIWFDTNGNAVTDPGELRSLQAMGVAALGLAAAPATGSTHPYGHIFGIATALMTDGTVVEVADAALYFSEGGGSGSAAAEAPEETEISSRGEDLVPRFVAHDPGRPFYQEGIVWEQSWFGFQVARIEADESRLSPVRSMLAAAGEDRTLSTGWSSDVLRVEPERAPAARLVEPAWDWGDDRQFNFEGLSDRLAPPDGHEGPRIDAFLKSTGSAWLDQNLDNSGWTFQDLPDWDADDDYLGAEFMVQTPFEPDALSGWY